LLKRLLKIRKILLAPRDLATDALPHDMAAKDRVGHLGTTRCLGKPSPPYSCWRPPSKAAARPVDEDGVEEKEDHDYDLRELEELYKRFRVIEDITMVNGKQALVNVESFRQREKHPVHLGVFILSWTRLFMDECLDAFGGFDDWFRTISYTDTDSYFMHDDSYQALLRKRPDIKGDELGQMHDDIEEVAEGKIIASRFVRPKLLVTEIIGYDIDAYKAELKRVGGCKAEMKLECVPIVVRYHKRAKGVRESSRMILTVRAFDAMLPPDPALEVTQSPDGHAVALTQATPPVCERRFERKFKDMRQPGICTRFIIKELNRVPWEGRRFESDTSHMIPIRDDTRRLMRESTKLMREALMQLNADIIKGKCAAVVWIRNQIEPVGELMHVMSQIKVAAACVADGIGSQQQQQRA